MSTRTTVTSPVLRDRPLPDHGNGTEKHERGDVVVAGGTAETPGAVLLAGLGALRAGAGTLTLAVAAEAATGLAIAVPEARVVGVPADAEGAPDEGGESALRSAMEGADAVLVGPGTFEGRQNRRALELAVEALVSNGVLVVDAAALDVVHDQPDLLAPLGGRCVLMPNTNEAAVLLDREPDQVAQAPGDAVALLVERHRCAVAVRGSQTWSGAPGEALHHDTAGTIGLGTSGSGDVLAGLVAGLVARGASPFDALVWAVHVHGVAGERSTLDHPGVGFLARELLDEIGPAFRSILA